MPAAEEITMDAAISVGFIKTGRRFHLKECINGTEGISRQQHRVKRCGLIVADVASCTKRKTKQQ